MRGHPIKGKHYPKMSRAMRGKHNSPRTEFKKGQTPWNKDKMGLQKSKWKGKKVPQVEK